MLRAAAPLLAAFLFASSAAATEVLFDPDDRSKTIFPSNLFTVADFSQNTFRRVNLAKPDCTLNLVRCFDVDVLNALDGFNVQPRVSIPFSGPIDPATVNSDSIFLVSLGSTAGRGSLREKVGINQVVWDPASNSLHFEPDELLEQHTRYAVIVTDRVRDAQGERLTSKLFNDVKGAPRDYRDELQEGFSRSHRHSTGRIVAASVFTTMSVSADLEKIQAGIEAGHPAPAVIHGYFPIATVTGVVWNLQPTVGPALVPTPLPGIAGLGAFGPVVGAIAFGKYSSPNYLRPDSTFVPVASRTGAPVQQGTRDVHFNIVLPAGAKPAAGHPVAIFGHGFGDHRLGAFPLVAASMAQRGIATIGINVVGHGFGPLGTITVNTTSGPVTVPGGGRGVDQNGDGQIGGTEGSSAAPPNLLVGSSDALRQTAVDLMQLVRQIQAGIDLDGDGAPDLDSGRIYYFGQSFGAIYGTVFLGVEPAVRAAVPNVGGGPIIDIVRISPVFRPGFANPAVAARGLLNAGAQFIENLPFRDEAVRVNNVPGAMPVQEFIDQAEWGAQRGNPVAYAPYVRKDPLGRNAPKRVILQVAKGDQTVPNPTSSALIRAGELEDRTTYYRHDLTVAANPTVTRNPHTFLTGLFSSSTAMQTVARQAQAQIAHFFATDGADTIDPDGAGALFETPIGLPLPETPNFIP
ncbi:MAG TPA: Ig-like domain-containing protein [Burkholderiales bacterium]|nr:Ig-like domain-containing protein [Burkholderiales bacterium]